MEMWVIIVTNKLTVLLHPNYNALEEGLQDLKKDAEK
jgi:hypothetical protein